ncbi:DUF763 domain-containing protein [Acidianus ambivalens]|uniref:DUF763 domain-containing protein n=1 Tax=Acidianus ambivalens TaxID=2283 RepID=A0A650CV43_ACIAM|nr:DUF763 domain-containing protein [Acidianus ambivalens]MQL55927.1 DUF763 domain-containing protein [Acidianus ambivalens]QGR21512.1 DUF763 domain-containing protein [Acidianus ambivalens]
MEIEGIADLPLHTGHVPSWLIPIMRKLSRAILDIMLIEWGPEKVVERLSNPLWFQAFNNVIGMDWDSSGSTTVTLGILKEVVNPKDDGLAVLGGKGKNALKVPEELHSLNFDIDADKLANISRLVAKVDTTLVQDGHQLYHHSMLVTEKGYWGIIQQGMNEETKFARRYHWKNTENFTVDPHEAIAGKKGIAVNIIEKQKENTRKLVLDLLRQDPRKIINELQQAKAILKGQATIESWISGASFVGISKEAKIIYMRPLDERKIKPILEKLYESNPENLEEALLEGLGPSTAKALYLISDLIYREPPSYNDPVNMPYDPFKYAYAIGGKDGIPYPVNRRVAEEVIITLEDIIQKAKLESNEKKFSLNKLRGLSIGIKEGS